jgi:hypothetical protein
MFQPAYKALRSNAAGWNVGEGGVGRSEAIDLVFCNIHLMELIFA